MSKFNSAVRTDFAMRGFAISFLMLARVTLSDSFLFNMLPSCHVEGSRAVPFRTVTKYPEVTPIANEAEPNSRDISFRALFCFEQFYKD